MKESGNHDEIVGEYNVNFGRENNPPSQEVEFGVVPRICAYLAWGNGWLQQIGFVDFAGSAVVHQANRFVDVVLNCCAESRDLQQ